LHAAWLPPQFIVYHIDASFIDLIDTTYLPTPAGLVSISDDHLSSSFSLPYIDIYSNPSKI
jgi:hypothetical protein